MATCLGEADEIESMVAAHVECLTASVTGTDGVRLRSSLPPQKRTHCEHCCLPHSLLSGNDMSTVFILIEVQSLIEAWGSEGSKKSVASNRSAWGQYWSTFIPQNKYFLLSAECKSHVLMLFLNSNDTISAKYYDLYSFF
jgi:hypothetical protein